ncbi:MAG: DUF1610 domain-containing protein [Nanoarchaeota archaeon]|nr:DUF1610 domain-containing protein [Nanoarchaeota archaeon]MBU4124473.1 DUF1610 domain-containing protein [Nanoarchaeota archaeon]
MVLKCSTCGVNLIGQSKFVKFQCPNCSETTIIRCYQCKKNANPYECEKCKFRGP